MHALFLLALVTFVLVVAFLLWTKASASLQHPKGKEANAIGIGSTSDPMAGSTEGIRDPEAIRQSLDAASGFRSRALIRRWNTNPGPSPD